jgi:DNA methylase
VVHVAGVGPLLDLTDCGDIVVDPFLGSGSTLSAADKTGRVCRGVELDPLYVDVIVRRFEAATGNQAVLVETGETFEALATQGAGTGVGLRPAPAVADVADEPPRNGRLLPVKRAGACTAEVRGSNPLSSTSQILNSTLLLSSGNIADMSEACARKRQKGLIRDSK